MLIAKTAGMRLRGTAILAPVHISSHRFVAASVPDLKRLEPSVELLSVPLDVQSLTGAVGMVDRVIRLVHRSIMSRSLVQATVPGLKQPESPSTKGTEGWPRTLCVPTRPWLTNTSVGLVKLAPLDVAGRCADVDMAGVAGSTAEVTRRSSSVWADVKPAKLYSRVGQSDSDSSITEVMPSAYFGQPNQ